MLIIKCDYKFWLIGFKLQVNSFTRFNFLSNCSSHWNSVSEMKPLTCARCFRADEFAADIKFIELFFSRRWPKAERTRTWWTGRPGETHETTVTLNEALSNVTSKWPLEQTDLWRAISVHRRRAAAPSGIVPRGGVPRKIWRQWPRGSILLR